MNCHTRCAADLALTAIAGFIAFLSPVLLYPPAALPHAPLFPLVRAAVERPHMGGFLALAAVGLAAGLFARSRWYLLGPATMALFPICTFAEMIADSTSHNLFPFEFVAYGIYSIPALAGAALAQRLIGRPQPRAA